MVDGDPHGRTSLPRARPESLASLPPEHRAPAQPKQPGPRGTGGAGPTPPSARTVSAAVAPLREVGRFLRGAGEATASIGRFLAAMRAAARQGTETLTTSTGFARAVARMAAGHREAYRREVAALPRSTIPRLTREEELDFLIMSLLLTSEREARSRTPAPLLYVALAAGRGDLAAALLWRDGPGLVRRVRDLGDANEGEHYLENQVFLILADDLLPELSARLGTLTPAAARQRLGDWLARPYIVTAVRHALLDAWRKQRARERWEAAPEQVEGVLDPGSRIRPEEAIAAWSAIARYLAASSRPEVDREIVEAMRSGVPMEELARRLRLSPRTLRHRRDRLLRHCHAQLVQDG